MLAYSMENETPFVHHIVEWQGCGCIVENDKSLNEKTQGQFYEGRVGTREGIKLGWSWGFKLDELGV